MICGILLAGGEGRRFGGGKLLQELADGTPIGLHSLQHLRMALDRIVVVVRSGDEAVTSLFERAGAQVVPSARAHLGMGHSLSCGVRASMQSAGWVVALADMPQVDPGTIRAVAAATTPDRIAVPFYRGRRGHPIGFGRDFHEELVTLSGDVGARTLLQNHAQSVVRIESDDAGILQDIDTAEDLARLRLATL